MTGSNDQRSGVGLRWLFIPVAAVLAVAAIEGWRTVSWEPAAAAVEWRRAGYGPRDHAAALVQNDEQLALNRERVRNGPDQWLRHEGLGRALMARSRLGVGYDDLVAANAALDRSALLAPEGSGPLLSAAALAMTTHRLAASETALAAIDRMVVQPDPADLAETRALRGDLAFYRGDMARSATMYEQAQRIGPGAGIAVRLANLRKAQGDFDGAIAALRGAQASGKALPPFAQASLALQIGAVEQARGRHSKAAKWFATANREFPGFWYFEAHIAQAKAIGGDMAGAIGDMRKIARRVKSPEVFDVLAMLLRADGQAAESRSWAEQADVIWSQRLKLLPEATYGHALEHELLFGSPDTALRYALANFKARPFGESRILLASAHLTAGQIDAALRQLAMAELSGWRSARLYALRAQAFELAGRTSLAREARDAATALDPNIFAPEAALVWFSHG